MAKKSKEKIDGEIRSWLRDNVSIEEIGSRLKEGLNATKYVYKELQDDYAVRLAYIDWVAEKAGYVPEKKISGGTFTLPPPSQESIEKAFGEERPADEQQPD